MDRRYTCRKLAIQRPNASKFYDYSAKIILQSETITVTWNCQYYPSWEYCNLRGIVSQSPTLICRVTKICQHKSSNFRHFLETQITWKLTFSLFISIFIQFSSILLMISKLCGVLLRNVSYGCGEPDCNFTADSVKDFNSHKRRHAKVCSMIQHLWLGTTVCARSLDPVYIVGYFIE